MSIMSSYFFYRYIFFVCIVFTMHGFNNFDIEGTGSVVPAYGKNINFLNDCNRMDKIFAVCYYIIVDGVYTTGCDPEDPSITAKISLKSMGTFDVDQFVLPMPVQGPIKFSQSLIDDHTHYLSEPVFWFNELWLRINLADALNLPFKGNHTLTLGIFPFFIGRGIALGYNNPDFQAPFFLIVPTFSILNQYPAGILLSGDIMPTLTYDFYGSVVNNKGSRFSDTAVLTKVGLIDHRRCGRRGFGSVHYYIASRIQWDPVVTEYELAHMEAYAVLDNNPLFNSPFSREQFPIRFSDKRTEHVLFRLKTFGVAGEYVTGNWEFGFDTAKNFGYAHYFGSDLNEVTLTVDEGLVEEINTRVYTTAGTLAPASFDNQMIINNSIQNQAQNRKLISPTLINGPTRFRDTFPLLMRGWMFIGDAAYTMNNYWKFATTVGISSGGPVISQITNNVFINTLFIGLQELYIGKRVRNAFFLNGSYFGPRPIDIPYQAAASTANLTRPGFVNMILSGCSAEYTNCLKDYPLTVKSNLLWYWSQYQAINFSINPPAPVPRFYGTEFNTFASLVMDEYVKWVGVILLFFPGTFYKALQNQPLTISDFEYTSARDAGNPVNYTPLMGADPSFVVNVGLEWSF